MRRILILAIYLISAFSPVSAQIEQASDLVTVAGDKFLCWFGHAGRTYFIQVSDPNDHLSKWNWAPIIESGNDEPISYEVDGSSEKGFFRLKYTDQITNDPDNDDFDGDGISNLNEITYYNCDPLHADTDEDGLDDGYEIWGGSDPTNTDSDGDGLSDGDEYWIYGTSPADIDSDGDGLSDGFELNQSNTSPTSADSDGDGMNDGFEVNYAFDPLDSADGANDYDTDGLNNFWEFKLKLNPHLADSNNNGISDSLEDRDRDGLTNLAEVITHNTLPDQPDTDNDGLSDGWEIIYGYSALINNQSDSDPDNNESADPDADGLVNSAEDQIGTNPNNADTDSDGYSDFEEFQNASNATDATSTPPNPGGQPGGPSTPPPPIVPVHVEFGDHSSSHSEKYQVSLEPLEGDANMQVRVRTNRNYGETQTETFNLPAGAKYKITLTHIGTDPEYDDDPKPDYDYTLELTSNSTDPAIQVIPEDNAGILGVHGESEEFFADGKDATMYTAWMTSETVATEPPDRQRRKVGVAEKVDLRLKPASLPSPTWALNGTPGTSSLSPMAGITSKLTAGEVACTPATEATINGKTVKIDWQVIQPTSVVFKNIPGTTVSQGTPYLALVFSAEFFVGPPDVNFQNITIEEEACPAVAEGYFSSQNGSMHPPSRDPIPMTGTVDPVRGTKADGTDKIGSGSAGPVYQPGTFLWKIPISYMAGSGKYSLTTVDQEKTMTITNNKATLTWSKNGAIDTVTEP